MSKDLSAISEFFFTVVSLLRAPATEQDILALLNSDDFSRLFSADTISECKEYLDPESVLANFGDTMGYDEATRTYVMLQEKECEYFAREAIHHSPQLADTVTSCVPWQARANATESLLRDIRNYFYANHADNVLLCLKQYRTLCASEKEFAEGRPFGFLLCQLQDDWYRHLNDELLSLTAEYLLPLAALCLVDSVAFEKYLRTARQGTVSESAILSIIDNQLLRGDVDGAKELLAKCKAKLAVALRNSWILYLEGKTEASVESYEKLLEQFRTLTGRREAFFQSIGGIFLVFGLIRCGGEDNLRQALVCCELGTNVPLLSTGYLALQTYLVHQLSHSKAEEPNDEHYALNEPFNCFIQLMCSLWEAGNLKAGEWADVLRKQALLAFPWVARECGKIAEACRASGGQENEQTELSLTGVVDSVYFLPQWRRMLTSLTTMLRSGDNESASRLCWYCTYDTQAAVPVRLRPVEQTVSKHGGWSKGRFLGIDKMTENQSWPAHFTLQDRYICRLICEERARTNAVEKHGGFVASNLAIEAAVGHPNLFWEGNRPMHFQCSYARPVLKLQNVSGRLALSMYPMPAEDNECVILRDTASDLNVYRFEPLQRKLAEELQQGLSVPLDQSGALAPLINLVTQELTLLSEVPLDFLRLAPTATDSSIHIRLTPRESRMGVECFVRPFPCRQDFLLPGGGDFECVSLVDGQLVRYVRDFNAELQELKDILEHCENLNDENIVDSCAWELPSLEESYQFILSVQELAKRVTIHWPKNQRVKVSRRIALGDVSITCKSTSNWFYSVDGEVQLDDGLVVSLKELLVAAKKEKGNFICLDDGQIVALADSFRKRLDELSSVINVQEDEVSFSRYAMPYLDWLMEGFGGQAATVHDMSERIQKAMELKPLVPSGLKATLRPYQQDGYVWLSRLDGWGAGACLADDMGLGKTIQAIAFLLSKVGEGPCLVVAPTSVCSNWIQEIGRFAPSLKLVIFGGNHRNDLFESLDSESVMVTSYGLLQSEEASFCKVDWRVAILDEAQAIKNHHAKRSQAVVGLKARFRLVTTGTPVENNLGELWSIFNFINPGLLGGFDDFQARFAIPIERNCSLEYQERLARIVHPFILRRIKSQVLTDLPPKTEIQLQVELSEQERNFYEALRQQLLEQIKGLEGGTGRKNNMRMQVIAAIVKLRQAACNPRLLDEKLEIPSSKLQMFTELLDELLAGSHKVLVFSQFVKHLALVRAVLDERGIKYQYLDGNTSVDDRKTAVDAFQAGNGDVFLISLRAGGFGLNLTAADYVIHLDPWWNPAVEDQASDRAHRIGQDKPVTIYRLIAKNTIEDRILQLHQDKRRLAESILDGTDAIKKMTNAEWIELLSMATSEG